MTHVDQTRALACEATTSKTADSYQYLDIEAAQHTFDPPLSRTTIIRIISGREVDARKFGTRVYITRESWESYLANRPVAKIKPRRPRRV
jgi:hypothetical protein